MKRFITGFLAYFSIIGFTVTLCTMAILYFTSNSDIIPPSLRPFLILCLVLIALSVVSSLIQSIIYIIYTLIFQKGFSNEQKITWCLLLWLFGLITVPIYWTKFIKNTLM